MSSILFSHHGAILRDAPISRPGHNGSRGAKKIEGFLVVLFFRLLPPISPFRVRKLAGLTSLTVLDRQSGWQLSVLNLVKWVNCLIELSAVRRTA